MIVMPDDFDEEDEEEGLPFPQQMGVVLEAADPAALPEEGLQASWARAVQPPRFHGNRKSVTGLLPGLPPARKPPTAGNVPAPPRRLSCGWAWRTTVALAMPRCKGPLPPTS